jgi:hypothetical protein
LTFWNDDPADASSIIAYFSLRNTGTNPVFIWRHPLFFDFVGSSRTGKRALLVDEPKSRIMAAGDFVKSYVLEAGATGTLAANLSRMLVVPEPGRYDFLVSTKMTISTVIPPKKESLEEIELISGPISYEVPASMVYTNTGKHPSSAVFRPISESFPDPNTSRTKEERDAIQRANEEKTNFFRQHWPWLLGEAPFPTNSTGAAFLPVPPPPLAGVPVLAPVLDDRSARWWLAGVAAACIAGVGFVILRQRRGGPPA